MSGNAPYRREGRHALAAGVLLVLAYFLVPVEPDPDTTRLVLRSAGTLLLVLAVALLVTRQVRRQLTVAATGAADVPALIRLSVTLVAGVLAFALADYVVARNRPDEFVNLHTRVDALYFALATLTTIGYGDVHAQGQIARLVVCAQMVFSIGVITTGASIVVKQLAGHLRRG